MRILYTIGIHLYYLGIILVALSGNSKAIKWLEGRHRWRKKLQRKKWNRPIWIHTASLGEFEQAKPLIEKIKQDEQLREEQIIVTFFSPSGYLVSRNYDLATGLYYLPLDTIQNAKSFLNIVNPSIAIFVKYDFWFNYLIELQQRKIPTLFFSCNFRKNQPYFKRASQWQKNIMRKIDFIYSLNEDSQLVLDKNQFTNIGVCGDTRYDKVAQNAERKIPNENIELFKNDQFLVIGGSTWPAEEELLWQFHQKHPSVKIIIAPHDVSSTRIEEIQQLFKQRCTLYSNFEKTKTTENNLLLIDNIGMLSNIYQYADVAFVGGGFTNDLHNILEPAAMGCVVVYGNNTDKYPEAEALVKYGGSFIIDKFADFEKRIEFLNQDVNSCNQMKILCKQFVHSHVGATQLVFEKMQQLLHLSKKSD
jgi:3-deoxy-D-manno-octulosonic-acid transferase